MIPNCSLIRICLVLLLTSWAVALRTTGGNVEQASGAVHVGNWQDTSVSDEDSAINAHYLSDSISVRLSFAELEGPPERSKVRGSMEPPPLEFSYELNDYARSRWYANTFSGALAHEKGSMLADLGWIGLLFGSKAYDLGPSLKGDNSPEDSTLLDWFLSASSSYLMQYFALSDGRKVAPKIDGPSSWRALCNCARGLHRISDAELGGETKHPSKQDLDYDIYWHTYTFYPYQEKERVGQMWRNVAHFVSSQEQALHILLTEGEAHGSESQHYPDDRSPDSFPDVRSKYYRFVQKRKSLGQEWKWTVQTLAILVESYARRLVSYILNPPAPRPQKMLGTSKSGVFRTFTFNTAQSFRGQCEELQRKMTPNGFHDLGRLVLLEYPQADRYKAVDWPVHELYGFFQLMADHSKRTIPVGVVSNTLGEWLWVTSQALLPSFPSISIARSPLPLRSMAKDSTFYGEPVLVFRESFKQQVASFAKLAQRALRAASRGRLVERDREWFKLQYVPLSAYPFPKSSQDVIDCQGLILQVQQGLDESTFGFSQEEDHILSVVRTWLGLMLNILRSAIDMDDIKPKLLLKEFGIL